MKTVLTESEANYVNNRTKEKKTMAKNDKKQMFVLAIPTTLTLAVTAANEDGAKEAAAEKIAEALKGAPGIIVSIGGDGKVLTTIQDLASPKKAKAAAKEDDEDEEEDEDEDDESEDEDEDDESEDEDDESEDEDDESDEDDDEDEDEDEDDEDEDEDEEEKPKKAAKPAAKKGGVKVKIPAKKKK